MQTDDEDDDGNGREPNKFDNLCDGVISSMALVQAALKEVQQTDCSLHRTSSRIIL